MLVNKSTRTDASEQEYQDRWCWKRVIEQLLKSWAAEQLLVDFKGRQFVVDNVEGQLLLVNSVVAAGALRRRVAPGELYCFRWQLLVERFGGRTLLADSVWVPSSRLY